MIRRRSWAGWSWENHIYTHISGVCHTTFTLHLKHLPLFSCTGLGGVSSWGSSCSLISEGFACSEGGDVGGFSALRLESSDGGGCLTGDGVETAFCCVGRIGVSARINKVMYQYLVWVHVMPTI